MFFRKILIAIMVFVMVSPAWGASESLGSIVSSNDATVRDSALQPGSTVFIGDVISVAERGGARIAINGGGQAEVLSNSSVRLAKDGDRIQMVVDRGQASFRTSGAAGMSALVSDVTVRPASGAETSAVIQSLSETHAIIAAQKGELLITTPNDGKTYMIAEGHAAELTGIDDPQDNGAPPTAAGRAAPPLRINKKKAIIWTVAIVGAGVAVTAYLLLRKETKLSTTTLANEVSPTSLN